jgi:predicted DNA binding CopG/RHH family protein
MKIDTKYWADYNDTPGPNWQSEKSKSLDKTVSVAVAAWNDEAEDEENSIDDSQIKKITKLAKEFFKKEGWISFNVVQAMIMQES